MVIVQCRDSLDNFWSIAQLVWKLDCPLLELFLLDPAGAWSGNNELGNEYISKVSTYKNFVSIMHNGQQERSYTYSTSFL